MHRGEHVAQYLREDLGPLPRANEAFEREPEIRLICPAGGIILFAAVQVHSSVPDTSGKTPFSIDFGTVHLDDVIAKRGTPNLDNAATGTVMRDYLRGSDFSRIPEDVMAFYDDETGESGKLIYEHQPALIESHSGPELGRLSSIRCSITRQWDDETSRFCYRTQPPATASATG